MVSKGLGVLGTVLLVAGLALGFRSVSAAGGNCGSVFDPAAGITPMACDARLENSGRIVAGLIILGIIAIVAALVLISRRDRQLSQREERIRWR